MPLYHTMGVRSLIAMSLIGGTFVCLPRFDPPGAGADRSANGSPISIWCRRCTTTSCTHAEFASTDVSSVRKLGFAGASMTDGLLKTLNEAFKPDLFVNHYGSSEIYTFTIDQNAPAKPGSAGKAGINQLIRVVRLNARLGGRSGRARRGRRDHRAAGRRRSPSKATGAGPTPTRKSLRDGWYFTGDTGFVDADGDLFVTGRVDDMIITGGENVSPVEIESCLSLHPAVLEVAVVGLPDERWGKIVTAFVKRRRRSANRSSTSFAAPPALPNFKRPRRFVFVDAMPKSPVGKLLRRLLVAGDYQPEHAPPSNAA